MTVKTAPRQQLLYSVYVIELDPAALRGVDCQPRNGRPAVYVGQTADTPEDRFAEHLRGYKASRIVHKHGVRLRPRLYRNYGPYLTRDEAVAGEARLADRLRRRGFCVFGGH